ncbi:uncharacterized protein DUF397 [Streptomyces sp. SLBN-118]|uniref:DUF397 domain-containing protein n=1 Tax=Streptomyces sp. SLBN-118 TaxID=2768454 RepID=UPI0011511E24|nr:DUF397 domain-containing protein [Streptomyces sp. SLBN-118]TQK44080.1 uncharacterized protein DUF397 [Streptomyces sp. SLBN-118]
MSIEPEWFKSSYSSGEPGSDCVEVAWRKSSYSTGEAGSDCVEVATTTRAVHVRDSKNTTGPQLALAPQAWADFVTYAADH